MSRFIWSELYDAVKFESISFEEQSLVLKSMTDIRHVVRDASKSKISVKYKYEQMTFYREVAKLIFAKFNEALRLCNEYRDFEIRNESHAIFKKYLTRVPREFEYKKVIQIFWEIYNGAPILGKL